MCLAPSAFMRRKKPFGVPPSGGSPRRVNAELRTASPPAVYHKNSRMLKKIALNRYGGLPVPRLRDRGFPLLRDTPGTSIINAGAPAGRAGDQSILRPRVLAHDRALCLPFGRQRRGRVAPPKINPKGIQ